MPERDELLDHLAAEILELLAMSSEPTTVLDEEMLEQSPGRVEVEAALGDLLARGLVSLERGVNVGKPRRLDGARVYEDDWWSLTGNGLAAISQPGQR